MSFLPKLFSRREAFEKVISAAGRLRSVPLQNGGLLSQTRCNLIRLFSAQPEISTASQDYKVIRPSGAGGPVLRTPVYAVFQLGSHQYKVSPGDLVYAERLKGIDVGAELSLSRVAAAGSQLETLIGRPYIDGASVTAVIEEQVQDAKVISFKKRRRKNSQRKKGHRQLLTGLRITGINGVAAPEGRSLRVMS